MKNLKVLFIVFIIIAINSTPAIAGIDVKNPPDVQQGVSCATNVNCSIHVTLVIGYLMGIYSQKERLNTIFCDSTAWDKTNAVQCVLKKYVSKPDNRGCFEKTNFINVSFVNLNIPRIDRETGYQYSCK